MIFKQADDDEIFILMDQTACFGELLMVLNTQWDIPMCQAHIMIIRLVPNIGIPIWFLTLGQSVPCSNIYGVHFVYHIFTTAFC